MSIQGENYKILLATEDKKFNKVFAALLENLDSIEGIPKFEVTRNKERVVIRVSAHPESFSFVARIIQEMEDFSMVYSFDKKTMPIETNVSKKIKSNDYEYEEDEITDDNYATKEIFDESDMVYEDESTRDEVQTSEEVATDSELNEGLTSGRGSQVKLVREYMLSMESFTSMQLKEHFPMMSSTTIANAINLAKQKGLIKPIARGEYVVNKT